MDLRLLRYFAAVAELEHVGKAAQRLHVSQSPLSRQIKQLEQHLGLELFVRERQRLRLTKSGEWLRDEAKGLLAHFDRVREEAHQRSLGKAGSLSVAFTSAAMWSGILPKAMRRFEAKFPGVTVSLQQMRSEDQVNAVESGLVDAGFLSSASPSDTLRSICVFEEPYVLAIPNGHALAKKKQIAPGDLERHGLIVIADAFSRRRKKPFLRACAQAGFVPRIVRQVSEPMTLLAFVESGFGIGLIRESASHYGGTSIRFASLPWLPFKGRTFLIRARNGERHLVDALMSYLPEVEFVAE